TERHPLGVITGGSANHAALRADRRKLRDLVVGAAYFERKPRLQVFSFEEHAVEQTPRQARRRLQRGLDGDVIHFGFEDSFYVIFLHRMVALRAPTLAQAPAGGYVCLK